MTFQKSTFFCILSKNLLWMVGWMDLLLGTGVTTGQWHPRVNILNGLKPKTLSLSRILESETAKLRRGIIQSITNLVWFSIFGIDFQRICNTSKASLWSGLG